ncbi:unnamed protein product [Brugia pahangi]|uniref:Uncharacterized protein n=1 Tax=Brugia pahangi TaxID=6280 RepID=A0A0N4TF06_BRUPA|nr:unnamed protein product [Brugia pahangi]
MKFYDYFSLSIVINRINCLLIHFICIEVLLYYRNRINELLYGMLKMLMIMFDLLLS